MCVWEYVDVCVCMCVSLCLCLSLSLPLPLPQQALQYVEEDVTAPSDCLVFCRVDRADAVPDLPPKLEELEEGAHVLAKLQYEPGTTIYIHIRIYIVRIYIYIYICVCVWRERKGSLLCRYECCVQTTYTFVNHIHICKPHTLLDSSKTTFLEK